MNHDFLIRSTNRIALYTCAALVYWLFIFLTITVFDLKIFRERITESFFMSVLGLFALLGGAVILNIMSNLSKISEGIANRQPAAPAAPEPAPKPARSRLMPWLIALTFPLLFATLFAGDQLSTQRKKAYLVRSAQKLVAENQPALASLTDYRFTAEYVKKAEGILKVITKIDKNFPEVMLIVPDRIDAKPLFLAFGSTNYGDQDKPPEMAAFIFSASQDERAYLAQAFSAKDPGDRFHTEDGNYQLYFPTDIAGKRVVLYFSDNQRYGKLGS